MLREMLKEFFFLIVFIFRFSGCNVLDFDDWSADDNALFPTIPIAAPWSEDEQCRRDSRLLMTHLKNKTYWAVQMWDSSGGTEFGFLYGSVYHPGNFDECMLVKEPIVSQYCGVSIKAIVNTFENDTDENSFDIDPDPYSVVWKSIQNGQADPARWPRDNYTLGICVPASCSTKDINESVNHHLQLLNSKAGPDDPKYMAHVKEGHCTRQTPLPPSWGEIGFWTVMAFLTLIQIITAFFDFGRHRDLDNESKPMRLLMAFSFKRNFSYLFSTTPDEPQLKQLQILHAAKVLSILFLVFDHRGAITFSSPIANFQEYEDMTRSPANLFSLHGDLLVDSFFFIGGLLSCYSLLEIYTKKFVNPLFVIFGRWVRLAPLYFIIVWFHSGAILSLGSGPIWYPGLGPEVENCKKNWWASVLFLNNYVNVGESCMIHSWYIPCDFHLFIVGVFIAITIAKKEKLGLTLLGLLTFGSILIPGILTAMYHLKPLILFYPEFLRNIRGGNTWQLLYVPTHARATTYLIGMITGYIIFKTKTYNKKMPPYYGTVLIFLCLGLLFAPMAYGSLYYNPKRPYNVIESAIFASLRRFLWGLGCFVFMMVNCFDKFWLLRAVSKVKFYLCLSKLTYSIYLIHFYMQYADRVKIRVPGYFSIYDTILAGGGDLLLSMQYGIVLYLLVELPVKKFIHELLFSKVIKKVKTELEIRENGDSSRV